MDSILVFLAFLMHLVPIRSDCPSFYKRITEKHSFCLPPKRSCNIVGTGVNDTQIKEILRLHNEFRSKIANGQETVVQLPPAADMLQMEWDPEMASIAQKYTEQCEFKHDCGGCRRVQKYSSVGQNMFMKSYTTEYKDTDRDWLTAITAFYMEVKKFPPGDIKIFLQSADIGSIGHFSQVIWAKTWKVGCGFVAHKKKDGYTEEIYACNYGPSGNYKNEKVYEEGAACSKCPSNTACNGQQPKYPGLCQVVKGKQPDYYSGKDRELFCDFSKEHLCDVVTAPGMKKWNVFSATEGSHVGIVLKAGEMSVLNFTSTLKAMPQLCFNIKYRNGPNVAGQEKNHKAMLIFHLSDRDYDYEIKVSGNNPIYIPFHFVLDFNTDMKFSIFFSVPEGAPDQYLEVTDISVAEGQCPT